MRRILTIIFLSLVSITLFAGGKEEPASTAGGAEKEIVQKVTIEFMHMTWFDGAQKILDDAIINFQGQNPNIEVKQTKVSWGESRDQLLMSISAGTAPDITMGSGDWNAALIRMGAFSQLDSYATSDFLEKFVPSAMEEVTFDGHVYGIPQEGCTWAMFYRKDLFKEAQLDPNKPPANWEELIDYAKKLAKIDNTGNPRWGLGFAAGANEALYYWLPFLWQNGSTVTKKVNTKWQSVINEPEARYATNFYLDLIKKHKVTPEAITGMDWENITNGFIQGDFPMMFNGMWVIGVLNERAPELKGKWATSMMPAGPEGRAAVGWPNSFAITQQSKHKVEAWEFLAHLYTGDPSVMDSYALSISSLNWTKSYIKNEFCQDSLVKPFVDTMSISRPYAKEPKWDEFRIVILNPTLQAMIRGSMSLDDGLEYLHNSFNRLHQ